MLLSQDSPLFLCMDKHAGKTLCLITQQGLCWEVTYCKRFVTFISTAVQEKHTGETENN